MLKFSQTRRALALGITLAAFWGGPAIAAPGVGGTAPVSTSPMAGASLLVPHRAIYKLALASVHNGGKVVDVSGKMFYEWKDACDGWTLEQRFQLHFVYSQADEVDSATNYTTWESKDGLTYRFNVRKLENGTLQDELRGNAVLTKLGGEGTAHYLAPKVRDDKLPAGTVFPTTHTIQLLNHAAAGDLFFNRDVFDGSDDEGTSEINAYIGAKSEASMPAADKGGVLKGPAWDVRMAFFPLTSEAASPDYEMNATMLRNGITQSMLIDYGDFTMSATLENIEKLPDPGC